jgi:hypothetical protein
MVAIFHHKVDNNSMNVVEKDAVVSGMLNDELKRCEEALGAIRKALAKLPRGSLSIRVKLYKNKRYEYHYLKFRDRDRIVNQHVSGSDLKELKNKLSLRKKYEQEEKSYEKRIAYLKKILSSKGRLRGVKKDK